MTDQQEQPKPVVALPLPRQKLKRKRDVLYVDEKHRITFWNGKSLLCEHKRRRTVCVPCGGGHICPHRKRKEACTECGGTALCAEHKRDKNTCTLCGTGSGICEHKVKRYNCVPCKGKGICPCGKMKRYCLTCKGSGRCSHGNIKSQCRECKGSAFCEEHGNRKLYCKLCPKASGLCEHKLVRRNCRTCKGKATCAHNSNKYQCEICEGPSICIHKKHRTNCGECGGGSLCSHGKQKASCKPCSGSNYCKHGVVKSHCASCDGKAFCIHGRLKTRCSEGDCDGGTLCVEHHKRKRDCGTCRTGSLYCHHGTRKDCCRICFLNPEDWCVLCQHTMIRRSKYKPHCFNCYCKIHPDLKVVRRPRVKELFFNSWLKEEFPETSFVYDKKVDHGCSKKRPDWYHDLLIAIFVIELDENQHAHYSCENKRIMEIFQDFGNRPLYVLRINPDHYKDSSGKKHPSCFTKKNELLREEWKKREHLIKFKILDILHKIKNDKVLKEFTVDQLFFNESTNATER